MLKLRPPSHPPPFLVVVAAFAAEMKRQLDEDED